MTSKACVLLAALLTGCAGAAPERPAALEASPRHHEWTDVVHDGRTVRCFVVYPESPKPVPAVLVLHENKGLTDWVRSVADRLGKEGFIAVAPDLLSGAAPDGRGTEGFAGPDAATKGIYALPPAQVTADLVAVADYAKSLPGCDGRTAVAGFCWGGAQTFRFATARADLAAAFVFYGSAPDDAAALAAIRCPVYGFYASDDARVNATLPATETNMRAAGRAFEPVTYPGAGHGFLRAGAAADASPANRAAHDAAWERWLGLLRAL
jgi:carboxymethylenebutenolidase